MNISTNAGPFAPPKRKRNINDWLERAKLVVAAARDRAVEMAQHFKIKGNDGNLYILRFDEGRVEWELTMFQNSDAASPSCQSLAQCTDRD